MRLFSLKKYAVPIKTADLPDLGQSLYLKEVWPMPLSKCVPACTSGTECLGQWIYIIVCKHLNCLFLTCIFMAGRGELLQLLPLKTKFHFPAELTNSKYSVLCVSHRPAALQAEHPLHPFACCFLCLGHSPPHLSPWSNSCPFQDLV